MPPRKQLIEKRKSPKQVRAQVTVNAILDAAAHILEEEGDDKLNTNEIARRAGVSIGSLYQYFPNKEALLRALLEKLRVDLQDSARSRINRTDGESLAQRIDASVRWHVEIALSRPNLFKALQALSKNLLTEGEINQVARLREAEVRRGLERYSSEVCPEPGTAAFLIGLFLDALSQSVVRDPDRWNNNNDLQHEAKRMIMAYLAS